MTELDLYYSQLAHFDKKPFEGLTSLKELELKHNQLSYLGKKNFEGLGKSPKIYLYGDQVLYGSMGFIFLNKI